MAKRWHRPLWRCLSRRAFLGSLLVCTAAWGFWVSSRYQRSGLYSPLLGALAELGPGTIHVFLCSDDTDLRPAAVAIKSAHDAAAEPGRLLFHVVTSVQLAPIFQELLSEHLPGIRLQVHHDVAVETKIEAYITFRESSKARKILASPFNFMPFYFDAFLASELAPQLLGPTLKHVIYIDTDTVVLGDMAELYDLDLRGHPVAAVPYCQQRLVDYLNFEVLTEMGHTEFDPNACIINRGIMVIDVHRWMQLNVTDKIEQWMHHYRSASRSLWQGGMSQPPWMLALNGDYLQLGEDWNCMSLGRDSMTAREAAALKASGLDHHAQRLLRLNASSSGGLLPYVNTCSKSAKLLHFNGAVKPWLIDEYPADMVLPRCVVPGQFPFRRWSWSQLVKIHCKGLQFVNCADLWLAYLQPDASCALKDFDKEWRHEEQEWLDRRFELESEQDKQRMADDLQRRALEKVERDYADMAKRQAANAR